MKAVLRYLGAKNALAPWIASFFPAHRVYVEPFGGSAAVLLNKPAAPVEVYNDLNDRLVNFWRVLREQGEELCRLLELTPYAQKEYWDAREVADNPVEDARRFCVHSMMSYGANQNKAGFRKSGLKRDTSVAYDWQGYPGILRECMEELRARNLEICSTDALSLMAAHDSPDTLFYIDPPYPQDLRTSRYAVEFDRHAELLALCRSLKGKVVISSYMSDQYAQMLGGWHVASRRVTTTQCVKRDEVLWMNFSPQGMLF